MGSYLSRSSGNVEQLDASSNTVYRYPPKAGNYFGTHFIMGGNKFETIQPEAYLFGDNSDLNFIGPKPCNFPYKIASPSQPVRALRCLVNIRKDSLRLVKVPSPLHKATDDNTEGGDRQITAEEGDGPFLYNIEFTFDADCPCSITIYYNATEEIVNKNVIYSPDPTKDCSDTAHYNAGCNQQFCLPTHRIDPAKLATSNTDWTHGYTKIPIVIQACAECGPSVVGHSHITYAEFCQPTETSWSIRVVKQKQSIQGVCYLLQEIYGIENKNASVGNQTEEDDDDLDDDDSSYCVVCLSETRDTLILPCKHLCLCSACANQLRYQQSGCPICRQSFRALLQIRAVRKKTDRQPTEGFFQGGGAPSSSGASDPAPADQQAASEETEEETEVVVPVPAGYEVVPLIDALKGSAMSRGGSTKRTRKMTAPSDTVTVEDETSIASEAVYEEIPSNPMATAPCITCDTSTVSSNGEPEDKTGDEERAPSSTCEPPETVSSLPGSAAETVTESCESQNRTKELLSPPKDSDVVSIKDDEKVAEDAKDLSEDNEEQII